MLSVNKNALSAGKILSVQKKMVSVQGKFSQCRKNGLSAEKMVSVQKKNCPSAGKKTSVKEKLPLSAGKMALHVAKMLSVQQPGGSNRWLYPGV